MPRTSERRSRPQPHVGAAEGHDPGVGAAAGHRRKPVGPAAGAEQRVPRPRLTAGVRQPQPPGRDAHAGDAAAGGDGAAGRLHVVRVRGGHPAVVDDAGLGRVQPVQRAHVRLDLGDAVAIHPCQAGHAVGGAAALELVQARHLAGLGCHDQLAAPLDRDLPRIAVLVQLAGAGHAQRRLQRSRLVVDALVDDAGVVAGLVRRDRPFALQHLQRQLRMAASQLAGRGQAEDAGTDHGEIALAAGAAHPCLSVRTNT